MRESVNSFEIAFGWRGAEGEFIALLSQQGNTLRYVVEDYRYWSPL